LYDDSHFARHPVTLANEFAGSALQSCARGSVLTNNVPADVVTVQLNSFLVSYYLTFNATQYSVGL